MSHEVKRTWNRFTLVDGAMLVVASGLGVWPQTSWMSRTTDHPFQRAETLAIGELRRGQTRFWELRRGPTRFRVSLRQSTW
jgi:hypothetical protein